MRKRTMHRVAALLVPFSVMLVASGAAAYADVTVLPITVIGTTPDATLVEELMSFADRCATEADPTCAAAAALARSVVATIGGCVAGVVSEAGHDELIGDSPLIGPDSLGCAGLVEQAREAGQALRVFVNRCVDGYDPTCATVADAVTAAGDLVKGCAAGAVATVNVTLSAPPDSLQCGATVTFVRDELMYVATVLVDLASACVNRTEPLCIVAFDAAELVQDRLEGCLAGALDAAHVTTGLTIGGTDPGCGGAVQTLASVVAAVVALVNDCLSGANDVGAACNDVRALAAGIGSAVDDCVTLKTGSPCRTALDEASDAVTLAETLLTACLNGEQAQCATATAVIDEAADCSAITQAAGLCVGYFTTNDEQDPILSAIAGALSVGGAQGAYYFIRGTQQTLDAAQTALVDAALDAEASQAGAGVELLYEGAGIAAPDVDAIGMPDTGAAAKNTPKEAKHGHCCATAPHAWKWHGTEVNWGYCEANDFGFVHCESLGHFWADIHSNINFFPDVLWSHDFWHKDGHRADFENLSVRMKQDIANKADPTKQKYSCYSGKVTLSCEQTRTSPDVAGKYYYVELNADVSCDCGKPRVHMQVQTRRWYTWAGYPYYPAYDNGG